jgi:hypothetical protein
MDADRHFSAYHSENRLYFTLAVNTCFQLFGRSLNHPSLRPAWCSWICCISSGPCKNGLASLAYLSEARNSLLQRLGVPGRLDMGDFLASFLLSTIETWPENPGVGETVHLKGCINLFNLFWTPSGLSKAHFPHAFFMDIKRHLFTRLKYCSEPVQVKKRLQSSFFLAFGNGPDFLPALSCLTTSSVPTRRPYTYDNLNIDMVEIFERLADMLSAKRPVQLPFDSDSSDRNLVQRISAYLDATYCNGT